MAGKSITPDAISKLLSNPSPVLPSEIPEIIVQVVDLKPVGNSNTRFTFMASDGKKKLKAMLPSHFAPEVQSGNLKNLGLIRILDYTCNSVPNQPDKALIVTKCEVVSPALDSEIRTEVSKEETVVKREVKAEETGIVLKPKQEVTAKSAAQILQEQRINSAPVARRAMTRRVLPLVSLNPYQGIWTIKVRVTNKGTLRSYRNARGEGFVFNVELTDEDSTQIQATMFNEAAKKFYPIFELGKVYYVSKGTLKLANKQFKTVQNDYEMTLNENSIVEMVGEEDTFIPETKFNFVKIDQLEAYVNGREVVDVIGVLQSVSPTLSVRRKSNNETIPKRDITIADDSNKTVSVSLWNDLATQVGDELLEMVDKAPTVAIKSLKVGDFQGLSLSTLSKSTIVINPSLPESEKLRAWYDSEGKDVTMASVISTLSSASKTGSRSMYADRVLLSHITKDPTLGQDKPVFFSVNVYISYINSEQTMWYKACKTCNKKVTDAVGTGYWCEACQKNEDTCSLRYIMAMKVSDPSGEAWFSTFNEQAEQIIGCTADELDRIKNEEGEERYQLKLKEATWVPHLFRVSVAQTEYMNEKRQRITVRFSSPIDYAAESRFLLDEISKMSVA